LIVLQTANYSQSPQDKDWPLICRETIARRQFFWRRRGRTRDTSTIVAIKLESFNVKNISWRKSS